MDGEFPAVPDRVLETVIADAEMVVATEYPDIHGAATAGDASAAHRVVRVVAGMVIRLLLNPAGVSSITEQAGPFSTTVNRGGTAGMLVLTEEDRRLLAGVSGRAGRAFTLWPGPGARS